TTMTEAHFLVSSSSHLAQVILPLSTTSLGASWAVRPLARHKARPSVAASTGDRALMGQGPRGGERVPVTTRANRSTQAHVADMGLGGGRLLLGLLLAGGPHLDSDLASHVGMDGAMVRIVLGNRWGRDGVGCRLAALEGREELGLGEGPAVRHNVMAVRIRIPVLEANRAARGDGAGIGIELPILDLHDQHLRG